MPLRRCGGGVACVPVWGGCELTGGRTWFCFVFPLSEDANAHRQGFMVEIAKQRTEIESKVAENMEVRRVW
jgi:hypothetical protein